MQKIEGFAIALKGDQLGYDGYTYFTTDQETADAILSEVADEFPDLHVVPAVLQLGAGAEENPLRKPLSELLRVCQDAARRGWADSEKEAIHWAAVDAQAALAEDRVSKLLLAGANTSKVANALSEKSWRKRCSGQP